MVLTNYFLGARDGKGRDGGECKCSSFSDRSTADHAHMFAVCSFQFIPAKFAKKVRFVYGICVFLRKIHQWKTLFLKLRFGKFRLCFARIYHRKGISHKYDAITCNALELVTHLVQLHMMQLAAYALQVSFNDSVRSR